MKFHLDLVHTNQFGHYWTEGRDIQIQLERESFTYIEKEIARKSKLIM